MRAGKSQAGQAAVEAALVLPTHLFLVLGILQLNLAYHAKSVAEYAAFKVARAGSVYRADCQRMINAATIALAPTLPFAGGADVKARLINSLNAALGAQNVVAGVGTPLLIVQYYIDKPRSAGHFDDPLDAGEEAMTLRVRLGYFFEYRVPFANWIITRYWLAMHSAARWAPTYDPTFAVVQDAHQPTPNGFYDDELLAIAKLNLAKNHFAVPVVATWSMRMMSDPLPGKLGKNPYRTCRCLHGNCAGE